MNALRLNQKKIDGLICGCVLLLPFLRYYDVPVIGVSCETVIVCAIMILSLFHCAVTKSNVKARGKTEISRNYFCAFYFWFVLVTLFYELATTINFKNPESQYSLNSYFMLLPIFFAFLIVMSNQFDASKLIGMYRKLVMLVVVVYAIQYLLKLFGIVVSFKPPGFNYNSSWEYLNSLTFGTSNAGRPVSLFSEPAHMCEFLLPYLVIELFDGIRVNKHWKAVAISIVIVSTISGNGIVGAAIVWSFYFICYGHMSIAKRIAIVIAGLIALVAFYYLVLMRIPIVRNMLNQLFFNNTGNIYNGTKADYRIYRGFDYYIQLPALQKIFGVGYQHMHTFAVEYGLSSKYDNANAFEFFSTITQVLLYSGFTGGILFFRHLQILFSQRKSAVKAMIIMSVAIWFSTQMLFANMHLLYITFIYALSRSEQ